MNRRTTLILIAVLVLLVVLAGWAITSRKAELADAPSFDAAPQAVHTVSAEAGTLQRSRRYLAEAEAQRTVAVMARVTERVEAVLVDEGDPVTAGGILARLDASKVEAQLTGVVADFEQREAEREAEKATRTALETSAAYWATEVERLRRLRQQNSVSQSTLDEAEDQLSTVQGDLEASQETVKALTAGLESLQARQQELRSRRADYDLQAPYSGVVTLRAIDPGDQAAPGKLLFEVETTEQMRLAFGVPREDLSAVTAGLTVRFRLNDSMQTSKISRIFPALTAARLARAEVDLSPEITLPPGSEIDVIVELQPLENTVLIPAGALAGDADSPSVYIVEDGTARVRSVTVQGRMDERVAVAGIEPGVTVITSPYLGWTRLADGMPVKVLSP